MPKQIRLKTKTEWLAARKTLMMASDSRGILQVGFETESPVTVYEDKLRCVERDEDSDALRLKIGLIMEEPQRKILQLVLQETVYHDRDYVIRVSDDKPWLGATIDGWIYRSDGLIPVEYKTVSMRSAGEWDGDRVPVAVAVQVQHQLAVMGVPYAIVMAWSGGSDEPIIREVRRDDEFIRMLIGRLEAFRELVLRRTMPQMDFSYATTQALLRMHPDDDGRAVRLPESACRWLDVREKLSDRIKRYEEAKKKIENEFRAAIGDHTYGVLPDGRAVSWRTQERKEYTVKASKTRVLRIHNHAPEGVEYVDNCQAIGLAEVGALDGVAGNDH